ncbi:putative coat protein [Macrophomina phaseolina victorivirus 1]|uniref:Coat protein n=1 Tax=Macrophomina phaseolina victorivirus 1 TaxID=2741441 RepID=A0A6M8PR19_9VIRU|nr:putative coat protein [Macrophomina phaseolina victorivirus 1]
MAATTRFLASAASPLTGSVAGTSGGVLAHDNTYRRYRSGLQIGAYEHASYTYYRRSIFYEVGRRYGRLRDALGPHADAAHPVDASVRINQVEAANFEGFARRYSNFSPQWEYMDLCGVAERLAKGVAAQSVFGGVNTTNLRANQAVRVVALGTLASPQTASTASVFIPRTVDVVGNDHVFAVLAAAVNGEGSSVTTDVLRLDANTNEPIIPAVEGAALASACVEALRIVGANMEASGAGDLFAYAVARGVHAIVSVVAHTDEGGFMRELLRYGRFRAPYGGINQALRDYPALPPLASQSQAACSAWVDAIGLTSAALVAHCDPTVSASGGKYPTVFVSNTGDISPPGTGEGDLEGDADARAIGRQISADLGRFAPLYTRGLTRLFGLTTNSGVAEAHFSTVAAQCLADTTDRHLRHKTVAPYFWVEPTSLIDPDFLGSEAEAGGFGALVKAGSQRAIPCFERFREIDHGRNANFSTVAFKMRTARTSGLVCAHAAEPTPLAGLKLYQFDEDSVVLAGDQGPTAGDVPTKHAAADPLSSYLWRRGQSAIPAPAEFMNIQGAYAAKYRVVTWDDDFNGPMAALPAAWEVDQFPTLWRVSVPTAIANGPSNYADRDARRARSRAAIALSQAAMRSRGYGEANSPVITVSNVPPTFEEERAPMATHDQDVHNADPGRTFNRGEGLPPDRSADIHGAPLAPIPHHQPLRGSPYPRQPGGVGVGGGPPPAPAGGPPPPPGPGGPGGEDDGPPPGPVDEQVAAALAAGGEGQAGAAGAPPAPPAQ